jgi:hypothetical protein
LPDPFLQKFNEANSLGLDHIDEIVEAQHFDLYDLKKYYSLHLSYKMDERKKKGMELFLQYISLYPFFAIDLRHLTEHVYESCHICGGLGTRISEETDARLNNG